MIRSNTLEVIRIAGGAQRLWPHVKTHKMSAVVRLQQELGINRFKCATIAEAEMLAQCGAQDILVAYPLIGPAIPRFLRLQEEYGNSQWWTIGDDIEQLRELGRQGQARGVNLRILADVDMGMHRTGVPFDKLKSFYEECSGLPGITMLGFHCYDGNVVAPDFATRKEAVAQSTEALRGIRDSLKSGGFSCDVSVMGGTPSFPCHAEYPDVFLSPGTTFVYDHGYQSKYAEMKLTPAAAILTRVISRPGEGLFTLDLGYKGIAADPAGVRGVIAGLADAEPVGQSEEHWVFRMKESSEAPLPSVGEVLYVVPTHICPTTALYPHALVAGEGEIVDTWEVTARNRKITI